MGNAGDSALPPPVCWGTGLGPRAAQGCCYWQQHLALSPLKGNERHYLNLWPFIGFYTTFYTTHSYMVLVPVQMRAHKISLAISGPCETVCWAKSGRIDVETKGGEAHVRHLNHVKRASRCHQPLGSKSSFLFKKNLCGSVHFPLVSE